MSNAAKKSEQRKRRAAGFEVFSPTLFKPKLIAWLLREGLLKDVDRGDRNKITAALEAHLRAQYDLPDVPGEHPPRYAAGSFGRESTTLRELPDTRPHLTFPVPMGLLEREGASWNWRDPPTRFLISRRNVALRRAAPTPASPCMPATAPPGAFLFADDDYLPPDDALPDDYDPELNIEEDSADTRDEAMAEAFDAEGFEVE
jgi:hypothetical protein